MNKLEYNVTKLMKELHTAEGLTKRKRNQGEAHATEYKASTSGSKKRPHKAEKKNCPAYLKAKEHSIVLITEAYLVADNVSTWILDSAATNHICCSLTGFKKTKSIEEGNFCFKWGDGSLVSTKAVGSVTLSLEDCTLNSNNVYFVPTFGKNLISIARLLEQDYCLKFIKNGIRISFSDNSFVTDTCMKNAIF